jgi:hypothetical protein
MVSRSELNPLTSVIRLHFTQIAGIKDCEFNVDLDCINVSIVSSISLGTSYLFALLFYEPALVIPRFYFK